MRTHTVFTLLDGSQHDNIQKAKEHCLELMGAELRNLIVETIDSGVYKTMVKLVHDKKYDKGILAYVAWRQEHDALINYEKSEFHE